MINELVKVDYKWKTIEVTYYDRNIIYEEGLKKFAIRSQPVIKHLTETEVGKSIDESSIISIKSHKEGLKSWRKIKINSDLINF